MWTVLLILVPLVTGLAVFLLKGKAARNWSLASAILTLVIALDAVCRFSNGSGGLAADMSWIPQLGSRFSVGLDGMGIMLVLLTAILFPVVFLATWKNEYEKPGPFFGLMLLSQAGLIGVFTSKDALLFYTFWELALIPVYFLCSIWGGKRRVEVTFKFFVYTFLGSLLMLTGIIYLYFQTPGVHSFSLPAFIQAGRSLSSPVQDGMFWLFFIAFAVKMPVFPFHTWQPDTYEQSPTAVTIILSAIMVKMGLFGLIRWVLPVFPQGVSDWSGLAMGLSVAGIVYASLIAIRQQDLKRMIAYSSIAHVGLMSAVLFSHNAISMQGVLFQMFSHGITITGMWVIVAIFERKLHTTKISDLGGVARLAPRLSVAFMIICLGNISLPLTNGFIGEFLMFTGLYRYSPWAMVIAGLAVILVVVYMLGMLQRVIFGPAGPLTPSMTDLSGNEWLALYVLIVLIIGFGVYPQPMLNLVHDTTQALSPFF
ncbi:MAG TPA: NADH-quinone oxidoreductase subunit M [Chitinophagaceae bacterium]|nr:NADH-quinone oxidoreductase subunit M [Chitinophagaceae bacterium]